MNLVAHTIFIMSIESCESIQDNGFLMKCQLKHYEMLENNWILNRDDIMGRIQKRFFPFVSIDVIIITRRGCLSPQRECRFNIQLKVICLLDERRVVDNNLPICTDCISLLPVPKAMNCLII